jgi:hypothetical protein
MQLSSSCCTTQHCCCCCRQCCQQCDLPAAGLVTTHPTGPAPVPYRCWSSSSSNSRRRSSRTSSNTVVASRHQQQQESCSCDLFPPTPTCRQSWGTGPQQQLQYAHPHPVQVAGGSSKAMGSSSGTLRSLHRCTPPPQQSRPLMLPAALVSCLPCPPPPPHTRPRCT